MSGNSPGRMLDPEGLVRWACRRSTGRKVGLARKEGLGRGSLLLQGGATVKCVSVRLRIVQLHLESTQGDTRGDQSPYYRPTEPVLAALRAEQQKGTALFFLRTL